MVIFDHAGDYVTAYCFGCKEIKLLFILFKIFQVEKNLNKFRYIITHEIKVHNTTWKEEILSS